MSSSLLNRIRRSTGFRLTARYAILYIVSSLALFVITYMLLSGVVREQDRKLLREKVNEYGFIERSRSVGQLVDVVRRDTESDENPDYYVRIEDPAGQELLTLIPPDWKSLPSDLFDGKSEEHTQWYLWQPPGTGEFYEFAARRLPDGVTIIVGGDAREREELLAQFQRIFTGITASVVLLGVVAGTLLANRTLAPIRDLIATVRSIDLGRLDARVPTRHTGDELDELASLFNAMLARISTLIAGMRDALDNVAHDLRTPATRAKVGIETALQTAVGEGALREALMDCAEENERIMTTLTTLMDISEAETGTMRLSMERVDLAGLIEECAELYEDLAQEQGITLVTDSAPGLYAQADAGRIRQVLANLLDNALKYSRYGGSVQVAGRQDGASIAVSVLDCGEGIPPQDIPRIFERLYRGDKSRTHRGLGLGLSLVKAVLTAHGGDIRVESAVGKGTEFVFTLPGLAAPASGGA